ncbi:MAG: DNA gyrase subunit A [Desulfurivibrionaceae bacterium]|jgi:DNA gyrase subunit A|nr:DNA gyrase subunit A [Pseudomonadota bacterium]MCG2824493.1 DNA gyrase subunit A [Desulfobulbaceae bacterium]MDP2003034.1 DNA gyrase subunit A [Desulfurivibrionaceae bacterium]PKN23022.1 MAG: DNA gyrase subunit A [Deltaproteobacteria bacterium HGW-Deltaproteobacteria-3]MBU4230888.1 DNA gyrase subunit A [Pseudomonadota bacterium]
MSEEMTQDLPISSISIEKELKKSYLDYAMSVIIGRALPDVRDGLKPVHRRALFAMRELSNFHNRPHLKSARIVGDVIGKYHPHGDTAAYDTIVRMAQDFSMRYPLVDGQGNFGSVDGDSPAAMRYTEARMTKIDQEIIADLEKETVDFVPTYDNSHMEPVVFPSRIPNLLINGSSGIAVGMATNIPPHNLVEVMNGLIAMIDDPNITVNQLMDHITGPDLPTGAFICGRAGIREAYETGRGSILMRSKTDVEKSKSGRESIIITEIPYQQNKAFLIEKIVLLVKDKRIDTIAEVRDESDRHGMRIVLDLKKDAIAEVVINQLYKLTPLQRSMGIILLSIVNNRPEILNLRQILEYFLLHRKTIVYRRTAYDLKKAEEKAHILEGLKIAITNLDEVVELIKQSANPQEAKIGLIARFSLSEIQAQSILEMRLHRLTGLEREKIVSEYEELMRQITWFKQVLADQHLVMKIIRDEFTEIIEQYGDERRTEIIEAPDEILPEDMIMQEEMVVTVTHEGYIKRNPVDLYRSQRRGGKGVKGANTIEDDFVSNMYTASTHDTFLFFTNLGKVFWRKVYEIPQAGRIARGKAIVNLLELTEGEKVAAILPVSTFDVPEGQECHVLMITKKGIVKKTVLSEFRRPIRRGKIALTIREDDEILGAVLTNGSNDILVVTRKGMSVRFNEQNVRSMGRTATGVKGINLAEGDEVVSVDVVHEGSSVVVVTENGYGKRSEVDEYRLIKRGGKGVFAIKASERNGLVVGAMQVTDEDELMMITNGGKIIRISMRDLRVIGRNTQGVRLFKLDEGEKVMAVDRMAEIISEDEEGEDEETEE